MRNVWNDFLADPMAIFALRLLVMATLVLILAWLASGLLRRRAASIRHLVWLLSVYALLLLPVFSALTPPLVKSLNVPMMTIPGSGAAERLIPSAGSGDIRTMPDPLATEQIDREPASTISRAIPTLMTAQARVDPWMVLVYFWISGLVLIAFRMVIGWAGLAWIMRKSEPLVGMEWTGMLDELRTGDGIKSSIRLLRSNRVSVPITWGFRPVVVLPIDAENWSIERRRVVLLHELAHIKRSDYLANILTQVACALYWVHPLMWYAAHRLRAERETACDDWVLRRGTLASSYATHLLEIARALRWDSLVTSASLSMARQSQLEGRLLAILDSTRRRDETTPRLRAMFAVFCGIVLLPLAAVGVESGHPDLPQTIGNRSLPAPSGPQTVGTAVLHLYDGSRTNGATAGGSRALVVQTWYPTDISAPEGFAPYLIDEGLLGAMLRESYLDLPSEVLESWGGLRTHSVPDAPIASAPARLPMLLLSPGFGLSRSTYTAMAEDLASHGYLVASIDHPHVGLVALLDGRILSSSSASQGDALAVERVREMAADASFVLDVLSNGQVEPTRFAGRIDQARIGMIGHSLGGAAALEACRVEPRIRACVDLDGYPFGPVEMEGLDRPYLVMLNQPAEGHRPPPEMGAERRNSWVARMNRQATPAYLMTIGNTTHLSFSDLPLVVPAEIFAKQGALRPPHEGQAITSDALRLFFGRHLLGQAGPELNSLLSEYAAVTVETFNR